MWRTDIGPGVVGAKHYHPGTECVPRNASSRAPYKSLVATIVPKGQPVAVPVK